MDSNTMLLVMFLSLQLSLYVYFVVLRKVFAPVQAIELKDFEREYILRAYRDIKAS